ncbi:radical SAM protein [Desulfosarcina sp. OttesenSCG-928-A07]|nr:radical SAM protein [Desulfosarcina sp. OttesenSCG-928-G17]MDL2329991.1 radical SAM protein [Desulfosarcina sp. OttesenSCG-928-A07]
MRVHIVPTYRCNQDCSYCYTRPFRDRFPTDLAFPQYLEVIGYLVEHGLTSVSFLGGEPTLWPHLSEAQAFAREKGLGCLLYTNARRVAGVPDSVTVNVSDWMSGDINKNMVRHLSWYRDKGASLCLRVNLAATDDTENWRNIIVMAVILGAQVSIAALGIRPGDTAAGARVVRCCKIGLEHGLEVHVSRPLPRCVLTSAQLELLEQHCSLRQTCDQNTVIPVVNPDGKTVFPCNSLAIDLPLAYVFESREKHLSWPQVCEAARMDFPHICRTCAWLRSESCQPGCLGTGQKGLDE